MIPGFTPHIGGEGRIESEALPRLPYERATQPEQVLCHRWRLGDVLIWGNEVTMHDASRTAADPLVAVR